MCTVCKFIVLNYLLFGSRLGRINSSSSTPQRTRRHTHGIALLCVSFRSHARMTIMTEASTVSKRTYARLDRIKMYICTQYRIKKAYQNASCMHLARSRWRLTPRGPERTPQRSLPDMPASTTLALSNGAPCIDSHAAAVQRNWFCDRCWEPLPECTLALGGSKRKKSGDRQLRRLEQVADERRTSHRRERRRVVLSFACVQASTMSHVRAGIDASNGNLGYAVNRL